MDRSTIKSLARQFARTSVSGISDTILNSLVDEAQIFIARDINGIPKRSYVQIAAAFYISTDMAFRMTIVGTGDTLAATDIVITATELSAATGATIATALQTKIRAATGGVGTSVAWTNFKFTITTLLATSQTIVAPTTSTYSDATDILFGSATETQTGTAWVGGFPQDCTVEAPLPTDFHSMQIVTWDTVQLDSGPQSDFAQPMVSGTPVQYSIRGDKIYFYAVPSSQQMCYIEYMSVPVAGIASDTTAPSLPTRYQMLLVFYTAYLMLLATHEVKEASTFYGQYTREKNKLLINRHNQNPKFDDSVVTQPVIPYLVTS